MLTRAQIAKINERFSILLETKTCDDCGSILAASFIEMSDGRPAVRAICLKCGKEVNLPRYKFNDAEIRKLNEWSNKVRVNDDWRCHICGSDIQVEAHHIIPKDHDKSGMWIYSPRNGIALCRRCHEMVHGEWMKKYNRGPDGFPAPGKEGKC